MDSVSRELRLVETFARLADTLVDDFDVVDLLQMLVETCTETLAVSEAGILLADPEGQLEVMASTSEGTRLVELIQLSADAGPCIVSYRTGRAVSVDDIDASVDWPQFRAQALLLGFHATHAVPLRLRENRIGTLNLFNRDAGPLPVEDFTIAQALADVATIGILQARAIRTGSEVTDQLQHALTSRVVIEQAKGVLSQLHGVGMDEAFAVLRAYSRNTNTGIAQVAQRVVDRSLTIPPRE